MTLLEDSVFKTKKIRVGWFNYHIVLCDQHGFELHFKQVMGGVACNLALANKLCDKINGKKL